MSKKKRGAKPKFGEPTIPVPFRLPVSHAADIKQLIYTELDKPVYQTPKKK